MRDQEGGGPGHAGPRGHVSTLDFTWRGLVVGAGAGAEAGSWGKSWGPDLGGSSELAKMLGFWVHVESGADGTSCLIVWSGQKERAHPRCRAEHWAVGRG